MFSTYESYTSLLYNLAVAIGNTQVEHEWKQQCKHALADNNLSESDPVPNWLLDYFQYVLDRYEVEYVKYDMNTLQNWKAGSWIGFAEQVLSGEWEFVGEYWRMSFDSIGMEGFIYYEGDYYEISKYAAQ